MSSLPARAESPLALEAKIPLGDVAGRIDHMAIDVPRRHLFVAELGNHTVGVVDLKASKVIHRLAGLKEPQGVAYVPWTDRLYIANAGDGAVIAAAADTSVLTGAAVGAVAGGVAGLLTDPGRVNLGRPIWAKNRTGSNVARSGSSDGAAYGASAESRTRVRSIQTGLAQLGYDPGPADGILGPRTTRAIQSYQAQRGLSVDGRPSARLAADIQGEIGAKPEMAGI